MVYVFSAGDHQFCEVDFVDFAHCLRQFYNPVRDGVIHSHKERRHFYNRMASSGLKNARFLSGCGRRMSTSIMTHIEFW